MFDDVVPGITTEPRTLFSDESSYTYVDVVESFMCDIVHIFSSQLVLRHNRLRHLPKELARLPQLKELHIQQNQINVLPPAFGE